MHRFFVPPLLLSEGISPIALPEQLAHQVRTVLRLVIGEQLVLLDNSGDEFLCRVVTMGREGVSVEIIERRSVSREAPVRLVLCQGLLKSARFEWILEKGTELGVSTFAPVLCQRSQSGSQEVGNAKVQRWQRIIQEAAEQCGRTRLPTLLPVHPLQHTLTTLPDNVQALMAWEEERDLTLRDALHMSDYQHASNGEAPMLVVYIGPEGGFTLAEVGLARQSHVQIVTLGNRILRAETAAIATIANIMYELAG